MTPTQARALVTLAALHGIDGPNEWHPDHYTAAEQAIASLGPLIGRAERLLDKQDARRDDTLTLADARHVIYSRARGMCEAGLASAGCRIDGDTAHHVLMRSQGGSHDPDNLRWVCTPCHQEIHAFPAAAYKKGLLAHRPVVTP